MTATVGPGSVNEGAFWLSQLTVRPTLGDVVALTRAHRNRSIQIVRTDLLSEPRQACGAWIALDNQDLVLVSSTVAPFAHIQIVLHELAHMLLGHGEPTDDALLRQFPSFSTETVRRVLLNRTRYDDDHERAAEDLASRIHAKLAWQPPARWARAESLDIGRICEVLMS